MRLPIKRHRGMTLVEITIAMFVLALMMTMVVTAIASAIQNGSRMSNQLETLRQATAGLDALERELRMCQQVYSPNPGQDSYSQYCYLKQCCGTWPLPAACSPGTPYSPDVSSGKAPFVFVHPTYPTGGSGPYQLVVVGYQWNKATGVLQRLQYDPGYDPSNPSSQIPLNNGSWQLMAQNVTGFTVLREDNVNTQNTPYIGIQMAVSNGNYLKIPFNVCVPVERISSGYAHCYCY